MKFPHLFEFMDQPWLPDSLRDTMREILECGNTKPFRPYYQWVADETLECAHERGIKSIVELGAAAGPITRHMASDSRSNGLRLIVSDSNPDRVAYKVLEQRYPGKVQPCYEPVDFSKSIDWGPRTLLVLSGAFHHIPAEARYDVLGSMAASADCILVVEPLRKTLVSTGFMFGSAVPALLLPLWFLPRPGKLRRFFWCWMMPLAPLLFWWDGFVTCLRMWNRQEWQTAFQSLPSSWSGDVRTSLFCQRVMISQQVTSHRTDLVNS